MSLIRFSVILSSILYIIPSVAASGPPLYPDIRSMVPQQVQLVRAGGRELIRFSNSLVNTGLGPWQMRAVVPPNNQQPQLAKQEVLDAAGTVVVSRVVSEYVFHPTHNHWHIAGVALFEVRRNSPTGVLVGNAVKNTSCLIDWIKLDGNSPNKERRYSSCNAATQGVSPGWVDQYHQSLEGQSIDITGASEGLYYLVTKANPDRKFIESNMNNDNAWVSFRLSRVSGNPKITLVGHSPCSGGLCGGIPNR